MAFPHWSYLKAFFALNDLGRFCVPVVDKLGYYPRQRKRKDIYPDSGQLLNRQTNSTPLPFLSRTLANWLSFSYMLCHVAIVLHFVKPHRKLGGILCVNVHAKGIARKNFTNLGFVTVYSRLMQYVQMLNRDKGCVAIESRITVIVFDKVKCASSSSTGAILGSKFSGNQART